MSRDIQVPDIGDFDAVDVIEVLVSAGDTVTENQPLVTLESDKAAMEIPSPAAGLVREIKLKVGDKVAKGTLILVLDEAKTAAAPPVAPAAKPASGVEEVRVPDIGDFTEVDVIEVLVSAGDTIAKDQPLLTLESDKAAMEIPAPAAGLVREIKVKVGDKVSKGAVILLLQSEALGATGPKPPAVEAVVSPEEASPPTPPDRAPPAPPAAIDAVAFANIHASPAVRRFARELGVDLGQVEGGGRKGRITSEDVQAYVKRIMQGQAKPTAAPAAAPAGGAGIPPIPPQDFAKFGPVEELSLSRIKRLTATNLHRAWLNVPLVTHQDKCDITLAENFRQSLKEEAERKGVRVTMLAFLLKAAAVALKQFPTFCASLAPSGDTLILKKYYHIGVAVDTPEGLVVPVLRDVDQKSLYALSAELGELSGKAKAKKLKPGEMQGACFTISSLGGIGGTAFTPLVNAPEVAILGVTRSQFEPVWDGKQFVPRLMLPLSLSYDHRVIDGAEAARFVVYLGALLSDLRRLVL